MGKWADYVSGGSNFDASEDRPTQYTLEPGDTRDALQIHADAINNYQAPEQPEWTPDSGKEAPRAWNIHYTPSWFVEEQANRKNPNYEADTNWTNEQVDAIANYVTGKKNANPNEWRFGDPGWDTSTQLWNETIKPVEDEYVAAQKRTQAVQPQQQPQSQFYSFHNNKINTTDLAIRQEGNNLAPIQTQDYVDKVKASSPYNLHNIDKSGANYDTMSNSGKFNYNVTPGTSGTDVKNRKWYQRWSQPILGSVMSASGPANVAKLMITAFGGPAGIAFGVAWGATAGYSYLKGTGVIQGNKYLDKFIQLTDILDEKGAQAQGALAYGFEKAGGGDLTDWSKAGENLDFLVKNFDTIMHYAFGEGKASTEYNPDVVGIVGSLTPNMGANVVGVNGQGVSRATRSLLSQLLDKPEDRIWLERNQTTRNNSGLSGVYEIPEELLGTNAITYWLNYGQYLYDHGVTNLQQLEYELGNAINEVYGDLSNYSEFIEHEIGDPGNTMENMQAREMYAYGKFTGDKNLENAAKANIGSLAGDLTGGIPVIPDVIRFASKLFGGNEVLKTSGGIDEVINTWDMTNLQSTDPSSLTWRDRNLSGINPDGSLKSLNPLTNPNTIKNPFAQGAERIKQLFQTTNEWRATMAGDSIMNFISTGIEDAMSARPNEDAQTRIDRVKKFVDELQNPETISADSPFSKPSKTILFNSIKEDLSLAVRSHRAQIDKVIEDYANLEQNRQVLAKLADALGLTPEKVMQKYQNEKTQLTQMIINKADQNGGSIPEITFADGTPIPVDSRAFGDLVISMIAPFAGDNAKAYDPRMLMTQITSAISDGVTDTLINKYGIEAEGWVYRFGDTVKKLQHLWLLGLSPSYLANNMVNNVLTRSALGYGGFLTPKTINDWTERFGYKPERFSESMAEGVLEKKGNKTPSEKMREAIRAKRKQGNKFFDKVDNKLDWVSNHAGFFGAISGWVEERESRQIYTSAMMTYMARTWKPGVNFRKMDPQLENLIRSQNPDMVDAIYGAISSGVSMKEIEKAIYGTYVIPNIQNILIDAARNRGIVDAEDTIIELFTKGGVYEELQKALQGKRGNEIDAVIQNVIARAEAIANFQLAADLAERSAQVANDTANYGFAEAIKLGQNMADAMADVWIKSQDANTQLFNRRVKEGLKSAEFRALYQEHQDVLNKRWAGVYATAQQNYHGILNGLGFTDTTTKSYVDTMKKRDSLWVDFYQKTQPEAFQPYLDALVWRSDDTFETWDSRVKKAWKDYTKDIKKKYDDTIKAEQALQIEMDETFAEGLKASLSDTNKAKVDSVIIPLQEQIRNKRQEIVEKNRELRSSADNTNVLNEKNRVYREAQAERQELVNEYRRLQKQLYDEIRALGPETVAPAQDSATAEVDHSANIRAEHDQRKAEQVKQEATEFTETMTARIAEKEEMPKTESTTPEGYAEDTKREQLREAAEAEGATEEQADIFTKYFDEWMENLPSKLGDKFKTLFRDKDLSAKEKRTRAEEYIVEYYTDEVSILNGVESNLTKEDLEILLDHVLGGLGLYSLERKITNDDLFRVVDKLGKNAFRLNDMYLEANKVYNLLDEYSDYRNSYLFNRENLYNIAIRSGASNEVATAFSRYISLIADKWNKNHPDKDFFIDAPGIRNLQITFKDKSNVNDNFAGEYVFEREIRLFQQGDFHTLIHELGHGFQYTLDENQQKELAQYFGLDYDEYIRIQEAYNDWNSMSDDDKAKYFDMAEIFARGFVDYVNNNSAPTPGMSKIFAAFKDFVREVFPELADFIQDHLFYDKNWYRDYINVDRNAGFKELESGFIYANSKRNGVTLQQIFDQFIEEEQKKDEPAHLTPEQAKEELSSGHPVALSDIDLSSIEEASPETSGTIIFSLAQILSQMDEEDPVHQKENSRPPFTFKQYGDYLIELVNGEPVLDDDGNPTLSEEDKALLYTKLVKYDEDKAAQKQIDLLKNHLLYNATDTIPAEGNYVVQTDTFERGAHTIIGAVFHNGELVAYVPKGMSETSVEFGNGESARVLGVSPEYPDQWVYLDGDEVYTEQKQQVKTENPMTGDAETDSMGALDPGGQANHEMTYEMLVPILQEFRDLYKRALNDAMASKTFGSLNDETKELVRQYIDNDVRSDLMNTKYKTGKFGEMMRDAALLNYSKRYGFDNALTLLFPYQFWQTRSMWNWIQRMGGKGGKMWRRYARLKEMEDRNKKELMPSRTTGKVGIYLPFLPEWMGDALFMPTSQLSIVGNFLDPVDDWVTDNKAVTATAERYVQEAFENGDISLADFRQAMDPAKRAGSAVWDEMFAKAQTEGDHDRDLGNLFKQYFGMSLPVSIGKALITGNPDDWTQTPMTRTGTAFRAIFGDNIVGKGLEFAMSAPERALRKAAVAVTGNNDFRYQEFGNWGDYYIRNQVWDMVVEGRISAEQAITAQAEKDGNKIWEEAADRQRQELLQKTQILSATMPFKKMVEDVRNGNEDKIGDDFKYLLAELLTMWGPTSVVRSGERTWREDKAEMSKLYDTNDKEGRKKFYNDHPYYTYNNLRYENDPEQALRSYLYKSITDRWYDLNKSEQDELKLAFGTDFQRSILSKETRAYQTMDLNRLAAYAQALNGSIPYLATDSLNTMNVPKINTNIVPQMEKVSYDVYMKERERLYPGMADVSNIYYQLPVEDRKTFRRANPNLDKYWQWNRTYKDQHPEVANFSKRMTSYYDTIDAENVFALLDPFTIKELNRAAYTKGKVDKMYQPIIERAMLSAGITDSYDSFVKVLTNYILGE